MAKKRITSSVVIRTFNILTDSPEKTSKIAKMMAPLIPLGSFICLIGDLGSGKTTFVKGLARGVGAKNGVASPSFAIQKIYRGSKTIYHADFYRLKKIKDPSDFFEPLAGPGIWAVEWADRLPRKYIERYPHLEVKFTHIGGDFREITLSTNEKEISEVLDEIIGR